MEVSGKIIAVLPLQSGTSKAGREWKKQEYVLETHDSFPRKVKFDFFGDRVDQFPLAIGDEVTVSISRVANSTVAGILISVAGKQRKARLLWDRPISASSPSLVSASQTSASRSRAALPHKAASVTLWEGPMRRTICLSDDILKIVTTYWNCPAPYMTRAQFLNF